MAASGIGLLVVFLEPQDLDMPIEICGGRMGTGCMNCTCHSKPCDGKGG